MIDLLRLGPEAVDRMPAACLAPTVVPAEVRGFVHDHAEGLPLFVEELLAGLVDSGALARSGEGWKVVAALTPVVPFTYADAVRRRLHELAPVDRDVLLAAAVLGRRFRWSALPPVTGTTAPSCWPPSAAPATPSCSNPTTRPTPSASGTPHSRRRARGAAAP